MRIIIDIPKEFEEDFKQDKFKDVLNRLSADAHLMAGNYEQETATMLIKAFDESVSMDRIVEQLEEEISESLQYGCEIEYRAGLYKATTMVKAGVNYGRE